ncbi:MULTISPECIES: hypothetical protein [unclassified Sphingomonas]|uniref:hypothetical protein n=1 Tax=unclassified Sphingomonas TaxID=196159 RepID=UPI0006F67E35|nr:MULTISPECIES: hypothetical protein [unclassified Sphingomonas]KQX21710.1 hypothetical protein ASD17_07150 [Sphingomonas sp. Root1294]KQY73025.1 hypothetical protein ASD39_01135 [Sphingomonas sp. Root50]
MDAIQSPEADLDRELEELIGEKVRGTITPIQSVRIVELQNQRSKLMRPATLLGRPGGIYSRRFSFSK